MLARRLPTILPAVSLLEALDTPCIPCVASSIGGARLLFHPIAPHPQTLSWTDATLACGPSSCVDVLIAVQGYPCQRPAGTWHAMAGGTRGRPLVLWLALNRDTAAVPRCPCGGGPGCFSIPQHCHLLALLLPTMRCDQGWRDTGRRSTRRRHHIRAPGIARRMP
jgi:hypothetical protein